MSYSPEEGRQLDPTSLGFDNQIFEAVGISTELKIPMRGVRTREAILIRGEAGWGEFCPFPEYNLPQTINWLESAMESAITGLPRKAGKTVEINATIPAVRPFQARDLVKGFNKSTVKVKVANKDRTVKDEVELLKAVRDSLNEIYPNGKIRIDVNGAWELREATEKIAIYNEAVDGLEYVEQPCSSTEDLARLREMTDVPIAADESVRLAPDPYNIPLIQEACDLIILKAAPLGGVRKALSIAKHIGKPVVVSSALETSVGMESGYALANSLNNLYGACGLGTTRLFGKQFPLPEGASRIEQQLRDAINASNHQHGL